MKVKCCDVVDKLWFVITEIVVAVVYALSIYFRITSADFRINGYVWILIIDFIAAIFSFFVIGKFANKKGDNESRFIAYIYACMIAIDTCFNDSLVGVLFIAILLFYLVKSDDTNNGYNAISQLFLASVIGAEIVSVLSLLDIVKPDSIMAKSVESFWIDIVLMLAVIFQVGTEKKKQINGKCVKIIVHICVIIIDLVCVAALIIGAYLRINKYCVTADEVKDGTTVYFVDANDGGTALSSIDNTITVSPLTNDENQLFTFEKAEVDGYWHIVTADSLVFDVTHVLFEEGNSVIAWEENGVDGQHWTVEDVGDNVVQLYSYNPEYLLTWGDYIEEDGSLSVRTLLTSDSGDCNRNFFLKNADTISTPLVGWIVNGNRAVVIIAYIVLMLLFTVGTCVEVARQ